MSFFNPVWHLTKGKKAGEKREEFWDEIVHRKSRNKFHKDELENNNTVAHQPKVTEANNSFKQEILWFNVFFIALFHVLALYTFIFKTFEARFVTILYSITVGGIAGFGITAGVHRLWAHRTYKAKLPLKILLLICYTMAGQNDVHEWVRDHRVHHKFTDTDADPHNANRGVFFSHVGWLMQRKHPDVSIKGKTVDMSDILNDPLITFHTKYFLYFKLLLCFIIPTLIPPYCWNETWEIAILSQVFARYVVNLNFTWSVNSIAHKYGTKPYDKNIKPTQNLAVCVMAMGEGFHNYHHVFPWDYKAAELGNYGFNITTFWLDLFAKIGWAYDLKTPSKSLVQSVIEKRSKGTEIPENTY